MKISTCLIVKNELKNLKILVPLILEFSDEVVIVDTGSNDGTIDFINKNYPEIILKNFKWINDFSKARNFSIENASKDFILWLDADDRLEEKSINKLVKIKSYLNKQKVYFFKLINSSDATFSYQIRLFPNNKEIYFKYPIHEQLYYNRKDYEAVYTDIEIIHIGYENRKILIEKHIRNLNILKSLKEKDFYTYLQIGESYKIIGDYNNAVVFLEKALQCEKLFKENLEVVGFIYFELYKIYSLLNNEKKANDFLFKGEKFGINFPVILYYIGKIFYKKKDYNNATSYIEKFLDLHKNKNYINPVSIKIYYAAKYFLANLYYLSDKKSKALSLIEELIKKYPENKTYLKLKDKLMPTS